MAFVLEHLQRTYGNNGRHERMNGFTRKKMKSHNRASALICIVLSLCDAHGVRTAAQNGKGGWLTGPSSLSRGCQDLSSPQVPNRRVLSL